MRVIYYILQVCVLGLAPTSGALVQFSTLQVPFPAKYLPGTGGHLVIEHAPEPSNMNLACITESAC